MNYHFKQVYLFFFFVITASAVFTINAMEKRHKIILLSPTYSIPERIEIVKYLLEHMSRPHAIDQEIRREWTIPTIYLNEMPIEDMCYPNPIIDYFFSQGAHFANKINYKILDTILLRNSLDRDDNKNVQSQELLDRDVFIAQLCLDAKMRHCKVYKMIPKLLPVYLILHRINNKGSKNFKNVKIPKHIMSLIASKCFAQEEAITDIIAALEEPSMYSGKRMTPHNWLMSKFSFLERDERLYKEKGIAIFDPEMWKNNAVMQVVDLFKRFEKDKLMAK